MGQVQVYRSGDLILKQGAKPTYLSLIMKGMCKSYKSPNKSTVLRGKLTSAHEKAARFDLKYVYHHKLRDSLTPGALVPHHKASEKHKAGTCVLSLYIYIYPSLLPSFPLTKPPLLLRTPHTHTYYQACVRALT